MGNSLCYARKLTNETNKFKCSSQVVSSSGNVGNSLFRPEHIDRLIAVAASQLDPVRNENLSGGKGGRSY